MTDINDIIKGYKCKKKVVFWLWKYKFYDAFLM